MDTELFLSLFLFGVGLAAGIAPMIWPQHRWLSAIVFWLSCVLAIAALAIWISSRDEMWAVLQPENLSLLGLAAVACGWFWTWSKLTSLQRQVGAMAESIRKHVEPRRLSETQSKAIVDYLLPREKHEVDVYFPTFDEEASQYAAELSKALNEAGWTARQIPTVDMTGKKAGVGLMIQTVSNDPHKKNSTLLSQAMGEAKVPVSGNSWSNGNGGAESLHLIVARRPFSIEKVRGSAWW
ncbi:hypothetical protein [Aminobacter aminovorans]|uniref:hypothetical protein n=1 Tax=Aminobacter aminovorans TaxID=83263 RepID=UPI00285D5421|nr:hypothetical protein [Aminobacter aminovorans]MDR7220377.1 hypothetical protein [Aminobacter aminovorans]